MTATMIAPSIAVFDCQSFDQPAHMMSMASAAGRGPRERQPVPVFDWSFLHTVHQRTAAHRPLRERPEAATQPANSDGSRRPVLVVEDDRAVRDLLCMALKEQGLTVESARDGEEALDRITEHRPALVLLDMQLPGIGGGDVAGGIRARYDDLVPIVVVSAYGHSEQVHRLHPDGCLDKPFGLDDLYSTVQRALAPQPM